MMRCENCFHECNHIDFATFRNLCEHLYLDALARKTESLLGAGHKFYNERNQHSIGVAKIN